MADPPEKKKGQTDQAPTETKFPIFSIEVMTKSDESLSKEFQIETKNKLKKAE